MTAPAAAVTGPSFSVDPWDPGYGMAAEEVAGGELTASAAELDLDLEVPAGRWRPLPADPAQPAPPVVLFADGVRRIDARVWVHGPGPEPAPGIAASYAAGLACLDGGARIISAEVRRGLFTAAPGAADIRTRHAVYAASPAAGPGPDQLSLALQRQLADAEAAVAAAFRAGQDDADDVLVVDGPLRGRGHLDRCIGYIKTHHASYLPPAQAAVVGALRPGERTPAFAMGTTWRRTSWYLRLPPTGPAAPGSGAPWPGAPWSGVVRLECPAALPLDEVVRLANLSTLLLPPLASAAHKDPRAPQNLVPIGGLERELRRRLGDQQLLYRALRAAAV